MTRHTATLCLILLLPLCCALTLNAQNNEYRLMHYKQALRLNPHDEDTRYNLALCQAQLKNGQGDGQPEEKPDQQQGNENKPQQDQQQQQQQTQPNEQDRRQTQQYLNLARQAERRAREKLNAQQPRQKSLDKNW